MKYCPYCGTILVEGVVSFCMECRKKLSIKDAEHRNFQANDIEEVYLEMTETDIESRKEKIAGKCSQKHRKNKMLLVQMNGQ